jgi:hypothetical protein
MPQASVQSAAVLPVSTQSVTAAHAAVDETVTGSMVKMGSCTFQHGV